MPTKSGLCFGYAGRRERVQKEQKLDGCRRELVAKCAGGPWGMIRVMGAAGQRARARDRVSDDATGRYRAPTSNYTLLASTGATSATARKIAPRITIIAFNLSEADCDEQDRNSVELNHRFFGFRATVTKELQIATCGRHSTDQFSHFAPSFLSDDRKREQDMVLRYWIFVAQTQVKLR